MAHFAVRIAFAAAVADKSGGFLVFNAVLGKNKLSNNQCLAPFFFQQQASLDTIGVDPDCQQKGIGKQLIDEFVDHLRSLGVKKVNTLVDKGDVSLTRFFASNKFTPSATINLERSL